MKFHREDYVFDLPEALIAQSPAETRDASRLLRVSGDDVSHHSFKDIDQFFRAGDHLVLNQTKVMNARCYAFKENGVRLEVFVLGIQVDPKEVPVLIRPAKRAKPGTKIHFRNANIYAEVVRKQEDGRVILSFEDRDQLCLAVDKDGELPLPPYIKREQGPDANDQDRYQTVFAKELGAVAAPTAGLHFTEALLDKLKAKGVHVHFITHHVGIGTFKPLIVDDVREHPMEPESYEISPEVAQALNQAQANGERIIAVGTTSTRCLEGNYNNGFHPGKGITNHFIYPGYTFQAISGLVTNFHLPGSTLILLVCALMGRERMLDIYQQAIALQYRFYSYGDAMLLLPSE